MLYPNYKYVSLITYKIINKRRIVDTSLINEPYKLPDSFISWCRFSDDIIKYQNAHKKSLKGYNGLCYSDFLPIDIDNKEKPEMSLQSCLDLLRFLEQKYYVPINTIRIYFSGSKGFHLEIPTILFGNIQPSFDIPRIFKTIVKSFGFSDIDTKIYYQNCLWRLSNSINAKSGLYKIPLTYTDIINLSYEQLCHKAKIPNKSVIHTSFNDWNAIDSLKELWKNAVKKTPKKQEINIRTKPKLDFNGVGESKRNITAFRIAKYCKVSGYTINEAKDYIVNIWNPKNTPPEKNIQSLKRTVESVYSYNHYDSGSIGITKHIRTDPYYNAMDSVQKTIYIYFISHINEVEKPWRHYICKPNQCIFSYRSVAEKVSVSVQRVRTLVKILKNTGRVSIETLFNDRGIAECSRITFYCIDLTQYLTHQNDLSKNNTQLTQQLTTTNIQ